jgi:hypothetical protein
MATTTIYTLHVGLNVNGSSEFANRNRDRLFRILDSRHSSGYTVIEGTGDYNGEREACCLVSLVFADPLRARDDEAAVKLTAVLIKEALEQEAVWISRQAVHLQIV